MVQVIGFLVAIAIASSVFGNGDERILYDQFGNATIYHSDGKTSRAIRDQFGNVTTYHSDGKISRTINDQFGNQTVYHPDGKMSHVVHDQFGNATIYGQDGNRSHVVNDQFGNATIYGQNGNRSRVVNDQFGNATIYGLGGSSPRAGCNQFGNAPICNSGGNSSVYGSRYNTGNWKPNVSAGQRFPRSYGLYPSYQDAGSSDRTYPSYHDTGSSAEDYSMHRSCGYESPRSRPVIPGYRYIGEDNQAEDPSFREAAEKVALQAACYYGALALAKAFGDRDGLDASVDESDCQWLEEKPWGWVRWVSLLFYIIALVVIAGFVLVRKGGGKKLLNKRKSGFSKEGYERRCAAWRDSHTRRDPQGRLVSVEMPTALKNLLCGAYVVCALPGVIALWNVDWQNLRTGWDSYSWMVLVGCLILMTLPIALHRGKGFARGVVVFICVTVDIGAALIGLVGTFAEADDDSLLVMLIVYAVVMSVFFYLITILVSPETDEWLRMKKELKLENSRRRIMAIKAMENRIITSRTCLFVWKWYMWIAAVLIAICFAVILWAVFVPPDQVVVRRLSDGDLESREGQDFD